MATAPTIVDPPADPQDPPADPPAPSDPPANDPPADPAKPAKPGKEPAAPANDDWRSELAGEDADLLKYLGRFASKTAALADAKKIHGEIRAGKYVKPLGDDPTEAELTAYRKQMGVPDKPEGYLEQLGDGLTVGDDDKPFVNQFLEAMHGANAPPALTAAAIQTYYKIVEEQVAAENEQLATAKSASEEALREEYGKDYKRNLTAMHAHLDTLPAAVKEAFTHGYGKDGIPLGYTPEVMKWVISLALDANPLATVVPGGGGNIASAIADEIAAIEKFMRDDRKAYNKDEAKQARLRELYDARDKLKGS